jgi:hypothetical protein
MNITIVRPSETSTSGYNITRNPENQTVNNPHRQIINIYIYIYEERKTRVSLRRPSPSKPEQAVSLLIWIWVVPGSNLCRKTDYPDTGIHTPEKLLKLWQVPSFHTL